MISVAPELALKEYCLELNGPGGRRRRRYSTQCRSCPLYDESIGVLYNREYEELADGWHVI
jgi:hypothetical protein